MQAPTDAERKERRNRRLREQREQLKRDNPKAYEQMRQRERATEAANKKRARAKKQNGSAAKPPRCLSAGLWAERANSYTRRSSLLSLQEAAEMLGITPSELIMDGLSGFAPRPDGIGENGSAAYRYETLKQYATTRKDN